MVTWGVAAPRISRTQATYVWTALVVLWAAVRSVVVGRIFGPHGTNSVTYFIIDVTSSVPYGVTSARAVVAYLDKTPDFARWFALASVTFFLPDLYIVGTARHIPIEVWVGFAVWLALMTAVAIRSAVRSRRR